jgi:hypothetical protein
MGFGLRVSANESFSLRPARTLLLDCLAIRYLGLNHRMANVIVLEENTSRMRTRNYSSETVKMISQHSARLIESKEK